MIYKKENVRKSSNILLYGSSSYNLTNLSIIEFSIKILKFCDTFVTACFHDPFGKFRNVTLLNCFWLLKKVTLNGFVKNTYRLMDGKRNAIEP